jgi:DNA-binding Lrp family transcriptional regulator
MELNRYDCQLLDALSAGLPLVPAPYAALGAMLGMTEAEVLERIAALHASGAIRRFGVVVRHRELGYRANAMVVWDVPDAQVAEIGAAMGRSPFVSLCYRRPRRPGWPYNLYCMVHGRDRAVVEAQVAGLADELHLESYSRALLFSRRRFKQCGARYRAAEAA